MSKIYPLENKLRPPSELYSTGACLIALVIILGQPSVFMLSRQLSSVVVIALISFGVYRAAQGLQVIRYQRHIHRLPRYKAKMSDIPVSQKVLFLGKGFKWIPMHTQRLRDLSKPENQRYANQPKRYELARRLELYAENRPILNNLTKLTRSDHWLNPLRPLPPVGGLPALHGVSMYEKSVTMPLVDRGNHTLVIGTTGVGKTRLAEILINQDIHRGDVVIVIDPKGDSDLLKRMYTEAGRAGRHDDLIIFHLGFPEDSAQYNPIGSFSKITEVATRVANQLPGSGDSSAFKEFGWRFINIISIALVKMGMRPTYKLLRRYIYDMRALLDLYLQSVTVHIHASLFDWINDYISSYSTEKRPVSYENATLKVLQERGLADEDSVLQSLIETCNYDKTYYDKITASLGPLLEKLTTGNVSNLLSPDYNALDKAEAVFDWLGVIRNRKIVYVGLDALTDATVATAVGNAMLADLVSVSGRIYKYGIDGGFPHDSGEKPTICLHADEFNEVAADEFTQLLNKARGAGFHITAYTQTCSDIEARLGNMAKAGQNLGNLNNIIMLRVKEEKTANLLIDQLPKVPLVSVTAYTGVSDTADFSAGVYFQSSNEDRLSTSEEPMLTPSDLLNLPRGQAFCLLEGGQLYKVRLPLPDNEQDNLPTSIAGMSSTINQWDGDWQHQGKAQCLS
ncbi:MAG: conjugative coupling factor TraD, PFGI-1 class [Legionellales bacterium]|nr:conjugative coupling factor TraD, PFGI-1 class [Legionellales bacterium]|tara:strand:+ start:15560 stop:17602 length:2043 start_codon:yes stop_codon:yes gene_type:complete